MDNSNTENRFILIKKASGYEEQFSPKKLERSLTNAGALDETVQKIVSDIENWITPGITTREIYSRAFSLLKHDKTTSSLRYHLKQAIFEMGPTGYPFEVLIGQLFHHKGFETEVGIIVAGSCITHEMDVIATQGKDQHLVECKYHKDQDKQVSIQVPLYVRSRVNDIVSKREVMPEFKEFTFTGWVVTNTHFSPDCIQYAKCSGLNLMTWSYPEGNGLKENIEKYKLYPITVLENLNAKEKQQLLNQGIVSCVQLLERFDSLNSLELMKSREVALVKELNEICR
ncbi:MAG: restriction endonuclease [Bacteroidales bacterium]|nr:restriction endonuclease [Bacteroidales bacterium]